MESRRYPREHVQLETLITELRDYFSLKGYVVQDRPSPLGHVLQARKSNRIRDFTGTSYALTIVVASEPSHVHVSVGDAKWLANNKAGVATALVLGFATSGVGLLALAPGYYSQQKVVEHVWNLV